VRQRGHGHADDLLGKSEDKWPQKAEKIWGNSQKIWGKCQNLGKMNEDVNKKCFGNLWKVLFGH
jgi:hypothetical protein